MSCAVYTVLGGYVAYANKDNPWVVRGIIVAACILVFFACFLAWRDEHKARVQYEKELDDRKPNFELVVANLNREFNGDKNETNYMFSVILLNRGASSVALGWAAIYLHDGEQEEVMSGKYLAKPYILTQPDGEVILTTASLIQSKTLTLPLSTGDARTGRILFTLPGNRVDTKAFKVEISCFDFMRKKCSAVYLPAPEYTSGIQFFPDEQVKLPTPKVDKV